MFLLLFCQDFDTSTSSDCFLFRGFSGNHAAAVAFAAKLRGIPAHVVIPKDAPSCKVENVRRYGGHVIFCEPSHLAREAEAFNVQRETGGVLIHPYNDARVIRLVLSGFGSLATSACAGQASISSY